MKNYHLLLLSLFVLGFGSCKSKNNLNNLYDRYYEEYLTLNPLEATAQGDHRFNDQLPNSISDKGMAAQKAFVEKYRAELNKIDTSDLSKEDKIYFHALSYSLAQSQESFKFKSEYLPFDQFEGLPLTFAQFGSGDAAQPFKTEIDYANWLKRVDHFAIWADTAISNFDKGIKSGIVLPKTLVVKMIPQMNDLANTSVEKSLFFQPIIKLPKEMDNKIKLLLTQKYKTAIETKILPTYKKLADYLKIKYLPHARNSSGYGALPNGLAWYKQSANYWTTTSKSPDEIYQIGLKEVARITAEMEKVKTQVGYKGNLKSFFESLKSDPKLMPFKKPEEVLAAFRKIQATIDPNLKKMFSLVPKTKFEIRRTEAFRENSASAEYMQGAADGSRPGIFYVPIPDATKFNVTSGMESLFLHEAIPGHYYQVSLSQENKDLPKFIRFGWYGAYGEGWALYCESLGKELGLYTDPYQYMGALGDEIHRAIRLVVDVAIHTKGWTREQAIKYMMDNEAIAEQGATAEIERYMAMPGQALSYKIGALKIRELRTKYEKQMGDKFKLTDFHSQILGHGSLPLSVLDQSLENWAK